MSQEKLPLSRILDESDSAILSELSRLVVERDRIVAPLDERIEKLRSVLSANRTLPLFEIADPDSVSQSNVNRTVTVSEGPRGQIQRRLYEFLLDHTMAGYPEIIDHLYGPPTVQNHNNARNAVAALKEAGWISGERGHWKIERRVESKAS